VYIFQMEEKLETIKNRFINPLIIPSDELKAQWRPLPGFSNYEINVFQQIRNKTSSFILCKAKGRYAVTIYDKGKNVNIMYFKATAEVFQEVAIKVDEKWCYSCNQVLNISCFSVTKRDGDDSLCHDCRKKYTVSFVNSLSGRIGKLINSAKQSFNQKRVDEFDLTPDFLLELYQKQEGKCYYSGITMSLVTNSDWLISLERINPKIRKYIKTNVALCCWELNGFKQITKDKLDRMLTLSEAKINEEAFRAKIATALNPPKDQISKNLLRQFCRTRCAAAKANTKNRILKRKREDCIEFELTTNILLEKLLYQQGRCYYSNIPMSIVSGSDFLASVERLDPSVGYTLKNTVWACLEFNSAQQWTKEKFNYFFEHFKSSKLI
jgi:hypothetical protein